MRRFTDRVALITGAASGIGRALAIRLAHEGSAVVCADLNEEGANDTVEEISNRQGRAYPLKLDVTDEQAVKNSLLVTEREFGTVDALFNNAGIGGGPWNLTISVNMAGVFYGLTHGAHYMAKKGGGVIVNTASIAGLLALLPVEELRTPRTPEANEGISSYVAAKHGVAGLTKQFAVMYAHQGVRVNAVAPGYIETPMTQMIQDNKALREFHEKLHPMGRLGTAEEIAGVAAFLASADASFINGAVIPVDGGYSAR